MRNKWLGVRLFLYENVRQVTAWGVCYGCVLAVLPLSPRFNAVEYRSFLHIRILAKALRALLAFSRQAPAIA